MPSLAAMRCAWASSLETVPRSEGSAAGRCGTAAVRAVPAAGSFAFGAGVASFDLVVAMTIPSVGRLRVRAQERSEEHTSELQSRFDLVCRLLLEKKKINNI